MERVVLAQLRPYIETSLNFNKNQSAYRKFHSTETALLKTLSDTYQEIDKGSSVILVALDISSAFDMIPHNLLLTRLKQCFGITGPPLDWLKSYLSNRINYVNINSEMSPKAPVFEGVPQGSVLGPILFTTFISPISNVINLESLSHQQYADDTQIYLPVNLNNIWDKKQKLENCLNDIKLWFYQNGMALNPSKSEAMLLSTPQRIVKFEAIGFKSINVAGSVIDLKPKIRTLGVELDSTLSFNNQVNAICRSGYYHIKALKHIRKHIPLETANNIATAFVHSRLDYANSLLYNTTNCNIKKLQRVQNTLARVVTQSPSRSHSAPMLKTLHWLPVKYRIEYKIAAITHTTLNTSQPAYLTNLLTKYSSERSQRPRYINTLVTPRTHLKFSDKSFSVAAPKTWNSFPTEIRTITSTPTFKTKLKTLYISKLDKLCD